MNTYKSILAFLLAITVLVSCSKKDGPASALDVFKKQLAVSWKINSAQLDGTDVTAYYPNLTITFTSTLLATTNGVLPLWKPTVNITIEGTETPFHVLRDDGIDMTVVSIDATKLVIEFQYDAVRLGGRAESVGGNYHIEFSSM